MTETVDNIESGSQMKSSVPIAPAPEATQIAPSEGLRQMAPAHDAVASSTGEPVSGMAIAFIVALCVVVAGLIIEVIIQSKKEKKKV